MRPLALALLFAAAPCLAADPAAGVSAVEPLGQAFADGSAVPPKVPVNLQPMADSVRDLQKLWRADPKDKKLGEAVWTAYQRLFPAADREDLLARARLTYGVSSVEEFRQSMKKMAQRADALPPEQQKIVQARLAKMKAAFGGMSQGDGSVGGGKDGIKGAGRDDAARGAALAQYKNTAAGPAVKIVKSEPPSPGGGAKAGKTPDVVFAGVTLNARQQARVGAEVSALEGTLAGDNLNGYMTGTDKGQITKAWGTAVAKNVDQSGQIPNMKKTVNDFRDILLNGRESNDGTTRVAEHWGEMAVGTYSVGAWASLPASLAWNTFSITKSQLVRSYRAIFQGGPTPPGGNYWGETMNQSLVTESAAAGWASTLEGADHQKAMDGVVQTLKLDEFYKVIKQDGVLATAGAMKDRYTNK